jgi:hypothetical protein
LNDHFELPSLEEIQEMDRQRSQAIESLQISNDSQVSKVWSRHTYSWEITKTALQWVAVLEKRIRRISFEAYLCIAAEILAGNSYVPSVMIGSITITCYYKDLDLS